MIRRIEIENFMSLKNVSVDLEPLTIFIGDNGSGKSAIFKALVTVSRLLHRFALRGSKAGDFTLEGAIFDDIVWGGDSGLPIKFRVWFEEDKDPTSPGYILELRKDARGWSVSREKIPAGDTWIEIDENHPFQHLTERGDTWVHKPPLRGALRFVVHPFVNDSRALPAIEPVLQMTERFGYAYRYRPSASDIASFVKHPTEPGRKISVAENGWGVAAELQTLQGSDRDLFGEIEKAICRVFPHIKGIGFENDWRGVRLSFKTDRSEDLIPAPLESDGVLLATFLFWRLYTGGPHFKICLEEPENGLHPFLLAERFQLLKHFAYPAAGRPAVQLLVATHSPEFLRAVKAYPLALRKEIRLVEFTKASGTSIKELSSFRDAGKLIEEYLVKIHETWEPILRDWAK